jgi:hypothetical protein
MRKQGTDSVNSTLFLASQPEIQAVVPNVSVWEYQFAPIKEVLRRSRRDR